MPAVRVHVAPHPLDVYLDAVRRGGAELTGDPAAADALVWTRPTVEGLAACLHPGVAWVQLPFAGVEEWIAAGLIDRDRVWTSAAGAYATQVAEHALALALLGARELHRHVTATEWRSADPVPLLGAPVAIVGAGGIGGELIRLLAPLRCHTIAVNRSGQPVAGATETLDASRLPGVWPRARFAILAAPATAHTRHLVDAAALATMRADAWLVNVARGGLIDTDALVAALRDGAIAGAALDVTDPEPLPAGHPLWREPRAVITPHVANPPGALRASLAARIEENVARFVAGRPLLAVVDLDRGY